MIASKHSSFDSFEWFLQTTKVDLDFLLSDLFTQVLCEFYLNPRYLRGSDFLMRFSQGRWAEDIVVRTINATDDLRAIPYGPSSVAPSEPYEMELYFERLSIKQARLANGQIYSFYPRTAMKPFARNWMKLGSPTCPLLPKQTWTFCARGRLSPSRSRTVCG